MSSPHVRRAAGVAGCLGLLLVLPVGITHAEPGDELSIDNLPAVADTEIDARRVAISVPDIEAIDIPDIEPFEPEVTSDGDDTVVSLDTDVLFDFGKADLSDEAEEAVVAAVEDVPDGASIQVVGHTDSIGSDADNLALSKERAQAVAAAITAERDDLTTKVSGRGEKEPVAPNTQGDEDNPEGREKNRRVEIRYAD